MTNAGISLTLDSRAKLLYFQIGFSLQVSAAVVCAMLEIISALDPSSVTAEPRYLKLGILFLVFVHYH